MDYSINDIIFEMIGFSQDNIHDIEHFLKVYAYAALIGEKEIDNTESLIALKIASVLHDIACPLCREKYGRADGDMQELEGGPMTRNFLERFSLSPELVERVVWLVSHHHSYSEICSSEHRILLEADFLVNAAESKYSTEQIKAARSSFFRTATGTFLLDSIFLTGAL